MNQRSTNHMDGRVRANLDVGNTFRYATRVSTSPSRSLTKAKLATDGLLDSSIEGSFGANALYRKLKREQQSRLSRQQLAAERSRRLALTSLEEHSAGPLKAKANAVPSQNR